MTTGCKLKYSMCLGKLMNHDVMHVRPSTFPKLPSFDSEKEDRVSTKLPTRQLLRALAGVTL